MPDQSAGLDRFAFDLDDEAWIGEAGDLHVSGRRRTSGECRFATAAKFLQGRNRGEQRDLDDVCWRKPGERPASGPIKRRRMS